MPRGILKTTYIQGAKKKPYKRGNYINRVTWNILSLNRMRNKKLKRRTRSLDRTQWAPVAREVKAKLKALLCRRRSRKKKNTRKDEWSSNRAKFTPASYSRRPELNSRYMAIYFKDLFYSDPSDKCMQALLSVVANAITYFITEGI